MDRMDWWRSNFGSQTHPGKLITKTPTKTLGGIAILENGKAPIKQQLLP